MGVDGVLCREVVGVWRLSWIPQVLLDLPMKSEVILYTGLSTLQKKLYKAVLTKDIG